MTDSSIEYWFRVLDVDEDGYLSRFDLEHFFFAKQRQSAGLPTSKVRPCYRLGEGSVREPSLITVVPPLPVGPNQHSGAHPARHGRR